MPVSTGEFRPNELPRRRPDVDPDAAARDNRARRVLVIEDEALIALDLADLLESWGHRVVGVVCTMQSAMATAYAQAPDVAVVDVALGIGEDGVRIAAELKRRYGCDIVFVTAWSDAGTRDRMERVQPTALLLKPYASDALRQALT